MDTKTESKQRCNIQRMGTTDEDTESFVSRWILDSLWMEFGHRSAMFWAGFGYVPGVE